MHFSKISLESNVYGLLFIGLDLFVGLFSRVAAFVGALLLTLYYFEFIDKAVVWIV